MLLREVELYAPATIADSGTKTIDIDEVDPFTQLTLMFKLTNSAAITENLPPQKIISGIEIVDGGRTWLSLTGKEALGIAHYDIGHAPHLWLSSLVSADQRIKIPLRFGRWLGDPQFGFDPTKLRNPQLKVTYAKDALHATGTIQLGLFGTTMEDVARPPYCLMSRSIRRFTSASSGIEPSDLWTDFPYRRLFVHIDAEGASNLNTISLFKLILDEKTTVFELEDEELMEIDEEAFGQFLDQQFIAADHSDYKWSRLGWVNNVFTMGGDTGIVVNPWAAAMAGIFLGVADAVAHTNPSNKDTLMVCFGCLPETTYCWPFGVAEDPDTWFPAPSFSKVKLELTQTSANKTIGISVQQAVVLTKS